LKPVVPIEPADLASDIALVPVAVAQLRDQPQSIEHQALGVLRKVVLGRRFRQPHLEGVDPDLLGGVAGEALSNIEVIHGSSCSMGRRVGPARGLQLARMAAYSTR